MNDLQYELVNLLLQDVYETLSHQEVTVRIVERSWQALLTEESAIIRNLVSAEASHA